MLVQTLTCCSFGGFPRTLGSARRPLAVCNLNAARKDEWIERRLEYLFSSATGNRKYRVPKLDGIMNVFFLKMKSRGAIISASTGQNSSIDAGRKRKIFEHICLLKAKEDLSDEKENDMLDYLYTSQYQMGGIVAVSLGRISGQILEKYTHAFYMRFQRRADLEYFYNNPFYLGVLKDYVMPYCHGLINVDFESEVEDDILPIFRKGEEFNFGVEFIILIEFIESAMGKPVEDALASLEKLTTEFPSLVVQATQGSNFNPTSEEYTHGVVIRFRSLEAFQIFMGSSEYEDMWRSKFEPITRHILQIHFSVDPVGTELIRSVNCVVRLGWLASKRQSSR